MMTGLRFLILGIVLSSCSAGSPVTQEVVPRGRPQAKIQIHGDGSQSQIENGLIVSTGRMPSPEESEVQFWLQRYSSSKSVISEIPAEPPKTDDPHAHSTRTTLMQMRFPDQGTSIVYEQGSSKVLQVVTHEKR